MSSLSFLASELQSLASETRRKHPEIREAAEKALAILRAQPDANSGSLSRDGPQSEELLRPVFMGCSTKNAKVVAISLGSLQRLISLKAVPQSAIPKIVAIMGDTMSQGVDIQLKVLQALLSLLTNYTDIHDELLGDALLLCFRLQESRIAVVSSTAAATLRQLVMFVFDKVVETDKLQAEQEVTPDLKEQSLTLPDGTTITVHLSAKDAFSVFEDLCLLANSETPNFLRLDSLPKTFALELIESVLTNYHALFRKRSELLSLLRHHLCPLLLRALSERPLFPLTLRSTRVVFLLLKQFSVEMPMEAEVFMTLFIKVVSGDGESSGDSSMAKPHWMRVLAMEIIRGLCSDAEFMRGTWERYDSQPGEAQVFTSLISALKRLITEKPALLGVGSQMAGVGVQAHHSTSEGGHTSTAAYGLEVAGRVASVATATVSNVVGIMGSGSGLNPASSAMKLQCIDQLDKADSPIIPDTYIYLLGLQCFTSLSEGFAAFVIPIYSSIVMQRPRTPGETVIRAPPALDLSTLSSSDQSHHQLQIVGAMVQNGWPALLAGLSFVISTNLTDDLFGDVVGAYQNMINVAGTLGLRTPRDAFLTSLGKLAIPPGVVSSVDSYVEPSTPRTASVSDTLGFSALTGAGGTHTAPGLSERNIACLKVIISTAHYLSGSLGSTWFDVLELLQSADYVLSLKGLRGAASAKRQSMPPPSAASNTRGRTPSSSSIAPSSNLAPVKSAQHPLLSDLDPEAVQIAINRLFDSTKNLDDDAFKEFVAALCKLSGEMVVMHSHSTEVAAGESTDDINSSMSPASVSSPSLGVQRGGRRVSGLHMSKLTRSGDYSISRLGAVSHLNLHRLIYRDPEVAWNMVTTHLLNVLRNQSAPPSIRIQAAEVLDGILVIAPRNVTSGPLQAQVQKRVLDVLAKQVFVEGPANAGVIVDIRKHALETLHKILQSSGHSLVVGWETIFEMLGSVCQPLAPEMVQSPSSDTLSPLPQSTASPRGRPTPLIGGLTKSTDGLVRIAFQSLTLVCDSLESLSPDHLRLCIKTLGQFGRQQDTNIALTAAESLLWGVSDSIQAKRKDTEKEPEYSALWISLLLELKGLCTDARHEVRFGAIQTLFRTLLLYGATLSLETWDECIWKVIFPLLDSITIAVRQAAYELSENSAPPKGAPLSSKNPWDESKTLALQSIAAIFGDFIVSKIMYLSSFEKAWDAFLEHVVSSVSMDNRTISTAALRCLDRALKASMDVGADLHSITSHTWERTWAACDQMGEAMKSTSAKTNDAGKNPLTQDCLEAFVQVLRVTYTLCGKTWDLPRIKRYLAIMKDIVTYPNSPTYRPDIDSLTPVQAAVVKGLQLLDLSVPGSASALLTDLAEFSTLAYVGTFDYEEPLNPSSSPSATPAKKRVTYVALSKATMPVFVDLYLRFKEARDIYVDETIERLFLALSIPVKLKYESPPASKFGSDPPLWKTATTSFLKIVKEAAPRINKFDEVLPPDRVEGIWRSALDVFRGGLLADCTPAENLPLEQQEEEEKFDLSLITSLEFDVIPHLGHHQVPDSLITRLGTTLQIASRLHDLDLKRQPAVLTPEPERTQFTELDEQKVSTQGKKANRSKGTSRDLSDSSGSSLPTRSRAFTTVPLALIDATTATGTLLPRERFSYWCFDLLFLICSKSLQGEDNSRRRIAALVLPSLLDRCHVVLAGYIADAKIRGNIPFPRIQEEELLYILKKLVALDLWSGSLWAAYSNDPSRYSINLPDSDPSLKGAHLIKDAIQRSSSAHLFHLYSLLCEISSTPARSPSMWIQEKMMQQPTEIFARELAQAALQRIGREMGVDG